VGSKFSDRENVNYLGKLNNGEKVYIIEDLTLRVRGVKTDSIYFITYKDQLFCALLNFKSKSDFKKLFETLIDELSSLSSMKSKPRIRNNEIVISWMNDILYSDISYNVSTTKGELIFAYRPLLKFLLGKKSGLFKNM